MEKYVSLGPEHDAFLKRRKAVMLSTTVDDNFPVLTFGEGVRAWTLDRKEFIDFSSQICVAGAVGFKHPDISSAIRVQNDLLTACLANDYQFCCTHNYGALRGQEVSDVALAEKLVELTEGVVPSPRKVIFEVSGATAVNVARKICVAAQANLNDGQQRTNFVAFSHAFHGRHGNALDFSDSKQIHKLLHTNHDNVLRIKFPNCRNNNLGFFYSQVGGLLSSKEIAAVFVELIQGEGGYNFPDIEAMKILREKCHQYNTLFVVDEIQTGLGRTGKMFASEDLGSDCMPDMLILSKSIAGGLPLGVVITRSDILPNGDLSIGAHSSTMAGTPDPIAAALANLQLFKKLDLVNRSKELGKYFVKELLNIIKDSPIENKVLRCEGLGLMIGVEFADAQIRDKIILTALHQKPVGIMLMGAGEKAIRFIPALIITKEEIDEGLEIFKRTIKAL
jgi:4-aminobutyrate aminotransferase